MAHSRARRKVPGRTPSAPSASASRWSGNRASQPSTVKKPTAVITRLIRNSWSTQSCSCRIAAGWWSKAKEVLQEQNERLEKADAAEQGQHAHQGLVNVAVARHQVVVDEAVGEVPHQAEKALSLGFHSRVASSSSRAATSGSVFNASCAKICSRVGSDMSSRRRSTESLATTFPW